MDLFSIAGQATDSHKFDGSKQYTFVTPQASVGQESRHSLAGFPA